MEERSNRTSCNRSCRKRRSSWVELLTPLWQEKEIQIQQIQNSEVEVAEEEVSAGDEGEDINQVWKIPRTVCRRTRAEFEGRV
jgi:hypothetical protein